MERARKGDVEAFAAVFEDLRPLVFSVANRLVGPNDAEDVVMEAYLKAWQGLPRFRGKSSLKTWLYRITRNCGLDLIRSRQRRKERVISEQEEGRGAWENVADNRTAAPDRAAEADDTAGVVRAALKQLPEEHRTTLLLRFSDGLSYAEIAAATGTSIGTVMSRLFYGKRKLRNLVGESA